MKLVSRVLVFIAGVIGYYAAGWTLRATAYYLGRWIAPSQTSHVTALQVDLLSVAAFAAFIIAYVVTFLITLRLLALHKIEYPNLGYILGTITAAALGIIWMAITLAVSSLPLGVVGEVIVLVLGVLGFGAIYLAAVAVARSHRRWLASSSG